MEEPLQKDAGPAGRFLQDLETELAWEWKWMRWNRAWTFGFHWAGWAARMLTLAAATYQLTTFTNGRSGLWVVALIALFSTLAVTLPLISSGLMFSRRLELHDRTARAYDVIRVELRAESIGLPEAVHRYKNIREQSVESRLTGIP